MARRTLVNNWISYAGFLLAVVFLVGEAVLIGLDILTPSQNPYTGILIYVVGPAILIFGLLLVPGGILYEYQYRKRREGAHSLPVVNLNDSHYRRYILIFAVITVVFLSMSVAGTYKAYHLTESVAFCGLLCHQVMTPEYVAYENSPHARVACTECHIGPGADWFVKSKLSGAYQVYAVLTHNYSLPIQTPVHSLRPARETCEQCHWPEKFAGNIERVRTHYADDEKNTPYRVILSLKVGGGRPEHGRVGGIHWHVSTLDKVEYLAADEKRQKIPYVRVTRQDGKTEEFFGDGAKNLGDILPDDPRLRVMDCVDCHNRPSHIFRPPEYEVNRLMDSGLIDPRLPNIKGLAVNLLNGEYSSQDEAVTAIATGLNEALSDAVKADSDLASPLQRAILSIENIYRANFFPEWDVSWVDYPNHAGHFRFPGCYRCHNNEHKTKEGKVISNDCTLCHEIIGQAEGWDAVKNVIIAKQAFTHPRDLEGVEEGTNCTECHGI